MALRSSLQVVSLRKGPKPNLSCRGESSRQDGERGDDECRDEGDEGGVVVRIASPAVAVRLAVAGTAKY